LKLFRDGLAIAERLTKADPSNAAWQRDLALSYTKTGDVLMAQGNLPEAVTPCPRRRRALNENRFNQRSLAGRSENHCQ
jgi:hypothetical protein